MTGQRVVVVGHGMVGHRIVCELADRCAPGDMTITVFGEEPRPAYDRVGLSAWFDGATEDDLRLEGPPAGSIHPEVVTDDAVVRLDRQRRVVVAESGREEPYDTLVLATGSAPFVPPLEGSTLPGSFTYRTLSDLEAIRDWAGLPRVRRGVVVGGGLLGLEAANALRLLGLEAHVVEMAPRLMPVQLDDAASAVLRRQVEALGVVVHTGVRTTHVTAERNGAVGALHVDGGDPLPTDLLVFSAGIRPRDELARAAGLCLGERGGVVVDETLTTSDPHILAIGEVAAVRGRCFGLVAPGYDMARVAAARLTGGDDLFEDADLSTKLKLLGVDVASFGDAFGVEEETEDLVWSDPRGGVYKKLVVDCRSGAVRGGMLVGDASEYQRLRLMAAGDLPTPDSAAALLAPASGSDGSGPVALPDATPVCSCENVSAGQIREAVDEGAGDLPTVRACTGAGTGCGGCVPLVTDLINDQLRSAGIEVNDALCEHFAQTRAELYSLIRFHGHASWSEVLANHGVGRGCEVCKPAVASILASLGNGHVLDGDQASLQDTNDHALANLQRNGTYSVVPRLPGGEVTPDQLIALGQIAKDYDLYTKITGGQRVDLFGARLEHLPAIWRRVIDAGMESGHAYGKALRTVKSCVGQVWCRYGVQDSTAMAVRLELRYRGLRAPHKIKMAVSGCTRECAEAQSKDVGVIATERGWNLYVGGNGGKRPRHADLLATDLGDDELITAIDRFLMFYVRTADRLQRTASWLDRLDGGLDHLRAVVFEDRLGIAAELDADMARHVDAYECEWTATLADPTRLRRFVSFVNAPGEPDPDVVMVEERGQVRPIRPAGGAPVTSR